MVDYLVRTNETRLPKGCAPAGEFWFRPEAAIPTGGLRVHRMACEFSHGTRKKLADASYSAGAD